MAQQVDLQKRVKEAYAQHNTRTANIASFFTNTVPTTSTSSNDQESTGTNGTPPTQNASDPGPSGEGCSKWAGGTYRVQAVPGHFTHRTAAEQAHKVKMAGLNKKHSVDEGPLREFTRWLPLRVDKRKALSKSTCDLYTRQIAQMAYWLDNEKVDMQKFFNATAIEEKLNVYQKVSGTGPHGMVTRMDSLVMLFHWMGSNDQFDQEVVKSTMAKLKAIKITFQQDTREQQSLAAEEDEEFDILPSAIDDILSHRQTAQKMTVLQRKAQAGHFLTFTETLFYMRCLLVHLTLGNGQRVGAVTNMTLTEFKEGTARQRRKGGTLRVKVRRHKTKRQGRAKLFMEKQLQSWAETWASRIRPKSTSDNFLVTTTGKEVKSKHHHMHSMRFGKDTRQRIPNATLSRKLTAASCLTLDDSGKSHAARLMSHSESTADKNYRRLLQDSVAEKAFKSLKRAREAFSHQLLEHDTKDPFVPQIIIISSDDEQELPPKKKKKEKKTIQKANPRTPVRKGKHRLDRTITESDEDSGTSSTPKKGRRYVIDDDSDEESEDDDTVTIQPNQGRLQPIVLTDKHGRQKEGGEGEKGPEQTQEKEHRDEGEDKEGEEQEEEEEQEEDEEDEQEEEEEEEEEEEQQEDDKDECSDEEEDQEDEDEWEEEDEETEDEQEEEEVEEQIPTQASLFYKRTDPHQKRPTTQSSPFLRWRTLADTAKPKRKPFSPEEEAEILQRYPLARRRTPAPSVFRPVPPTCARNFRTEQDCRDKWRNLAKKQRKLM